MDSEEITKSAISANELAEIYTQTIQDVEEGQIIQGRIVGITNREVFVDVGYKAEGIVPRSEFEESEKLEIGQSIEVLLESKETDDGLLILSKRKADRDLGWSGIINKYKEGDLIKGTVIRKVKGGLTVDVGVEAFLPASLVALKGFTNLDQFVGQTLEFKIIKINRARKNIVLSRRDALAQELEERKSRLILELQVGQVREGIVKNITDFGVFVDLGGVDGLLHVTDMSWGRVNHPSEVVSVGDKVEVAVLDFNKENLKISLGMKQRTPNPWSQSAQKYSIGSKVKGKAVNIVSYGVFVELEKGIEGLIHVSELSWTKRINHPGEVVSVGDTIEAVVLSVDPANEKMALGMRQAIENPWLRIDQKYPPGTRIKGKVRNITDYGVFVEIEEGIDGLLHISDISWTKRINHPSEMLKKGQKIEAVVLSTDGANQKVSLGLKQLNLDPWPDIAKRYLPGTVVEGKVAKLASFGIFAEIEPELEGLVHISELEGSGPLEQRFHVGDPLKVRLVRIDEEKRQIALSMKGIKD